MRDKQYRQARHAKEDEQYGQYTGRLGMPRRMSSMDSYGQARHSKEDEQYGWYTGRLGMLWWKSSLATVQCGQAGHAIGRVSSVEYDR